MYSGSIELFIARKLIQTPCGQLTVLSLCYADPDKANIFWWSFLHLKTATICILGDEGKRIRTDTKRHGAWSVPEQFSQLEALMGLRHPKHEAHSQASRVGQRKHKLRSLPVVDVVGEVDLLNALSSGDPKRAELVQWVDECLGSGRDENGWERPARRRICTDGKEAWRGWLQAHAHITLGLDKNGQPTLSFDWLGEDSDISHGGGEAGNPALFMGFFLSDLRTLLAKCRKCGCYFILRQANRIKPYKKGTFCEGHQKTLHNINKALSAKQVRDQAKDVLFDLAANQFRKEVTADSKWFEDSQLRDRIVAFLNESIDNDNDLRAIYRNGGRDGVTIKWLGYATNRNGIRTAIMSLPANSRKAA